MKYRLLPWIIDQEVGAFQQLTRRWRPTNLLQEPYRRSILKDVQERYARLEAAQGEFASLDRGALYVKLIQRMKLNVQKAKFAWRVDDLAFLEAVASVFSDYGTIMRLLATDKARGLLVEKKV